MAVLEQAFVSCKPAVAGTRAGRLGVLLPSLLCARPVLSNRQAPTAGTVQADAGVPLPPLPPLAV